MKVACSVRKSPYAKLSSSAQASVIWTGGFWLDRFQACAQTIVPNIYQLFDADEISHCLANFRIAAGLQEGKHKGPPFADGDFYKWLEGASYVYGVTHDKHLKEIIDQSISLISSVQRDDGYIFTRYSIETGHNLNVREMDDSLNFESYNLGHLITAGCVHFQATGENTLLDMAKKAAGCLRTLFESASQTNTAKTAICPSHYMGLVELFRVTGDKTYLETASLAIALRDRVKGGTDDNQDRLPLRSHKEIVGHAVRATYLYAGVADLYAEVGDATLLSILTSVWESEEYTKMYINSGCGALYDGVSPAGYAGDNPSLARTHQAFGRAYELPNLTAYNETCATIGNILWNWRMFRIDADSRHVDRIEQSFYNMVLASVSLNGKKYFYSNMLKREAKSLPFHLKWERTRLPYLSSFCCPPNMMRMLSESSEYAYAVDDDGVYTCIYGESIAHLQLPDGRNITLEQKTEYPWDGRISITYTEEASQMFTLHIRIPSWVKNGTISVPLDSHLLLDASKANTYVPVRRQWKCGDSVQIDFPMQAELFVAHPLIEENEHHVAVMRGPLLYCAEECDNSSGEFDSLGIKLSAKFSASTMIIDGVPLICLDTDDGVSYENFLWNDTTLYRGATGLSPHKTPVRLIPYFAWDNRSIGAMKVWFPLYV